MDHAAGIAHLHVEYRLLAAAIAAARPDEPVSSCPGWTVADLAAHVTTVYRHKTESMRRGENPRPWPPPGGVGTLDDAFAELIGEFAARPAEQPTVTWFTPDQTVGFWIRRMAHETAVHRVDAELGADFPITPVDEELALDGIDELLRTNVEFAFASWPEDFTEVFHGADPRPVLIDAGRRAWWITTGPTEIVVTDAEPDTEPDTEPARLTGRPGELYRYLWGRPGDVRFQGGAERAAQLSAVLAVAL
ncbi:maleylpyruvate isomerase family mycothiol-dependent enzyme [Pseudonocardia sp. GCM10023141]|uniref:maleylpyruvate isomerase family mycothiol-dependent enzyme n=1 Tax=Pseudonocardia sp. GCM10023141 TaxID=3252653 RepID=UPI00361F96AA